jgi:N-acetylglucosamine-6-phosphate deacetylase
VSIISAPQVLVDGRLIGPAGVVIEDGTIADVVDGRPAPGPDHLALDSGVLSPGLVDVQVNGAYGVDLVIADEAGWETVASGLPSTGVTSFQPTFITATIEAQLEGVARAAKAREQLAGRGSAKILGVHLEGPFLSPYQPGMHPAHLMIAPTPALLDQILDDEAARTTLTMVTLAPELPGAIDAVRRFVSAGVVVSLGHSDATADVVRAAVDAGARKITHVFNAQRGFGHREPGVAGQALADKRLVLGLIADLQHVAAPVCQVVFEIAAERVTLVTDAMAAMGMPPGDYELGGVEVLVAPDDSLPRLEDGTIAGSALTLDKAVRNLVSIGIDPAVVLNAATRVPATLLGRVELGRIASGAAADLVWWSDDYRPLRTWIDGVEVFAAADALAPSASP